MRAAEKRGTYEYGGRQHYRFAFFGDFFGVKDSADLAKALIGTKLEQQALESRLADFDIAQYFHGLEKNDFLNLLLQSE